MYTVILGLLTYNSTKQTRKGSAAYVHYIIICSTDTYRNLKKQKGCIHNIRIWRYVNKRVFVFRKIVFPYNSITGIT
jgi:hypothetical protein